MNIYVKFRKKIILEDLSKSSLREAESIIIRTKTMAGSQETKLRA